LNKSPKVLVIAGPNGSGKSTIYSKRGNAAIYINADEIKDRDEISYLDAAKEAENLREWCLSNCRDYVFETVLSTDRNILHLQKAKKKGYFIKAIFVLTKDVELNVFRVKSRAMRGGHDVPDEKIRNRYHKSLTFLPALIKLSDECYVIDNTDKPSIIFTKKNSELIAIENKYWSWENVMALCEER
jgi:predicted ABC-type ATPase